MPTDHSQSPDHRPDFWEPNRPPKHNDNVWDNYGIGPRYDTPHRTRNTLLGLLAAPVLLLLLYAMLGGLHDVWIALQPVMP